MMKSYIRNSLVFLLLFLATGCSKEFLNENLTPDTLPVGESNIYISPGWESSDYLFRLPSVKEVDYEIVSKPTWLKISSVSGHMSDSIAIVECSATKNSAFSTAGIYLDFMTVSAGGKNYKIPVGYISEGDPSVLVENDLLIFNDNYYNPELKIQNNGSGVLLWGVSSMPDWLSIDEARLRFEGIYISPHTSYLIPLVFGPDPVFTGTLTGDIVLTTNDKEHPSIKVGVTAELGIPQLNLQTSTIDFSYSDTTKKLCLGNCEDGSLIWKFEGMPEWLSIAPSSGIIMRHSFFNVIFNCDRTKLEPGQNSATVVLKTNDISHPSTNITVTAFVPETNENVHPIAGNITDAVFDKNTNTLYYTTSAPDKFIAYDVTAKTVLKEIPLSTAPTCFAINEGWTKAAVGHNGYISALDLPGNTVSNVYISNYSIRDMAWGENDWFSYTQNGGCNSGLHWINIVDGTLDNDPSQGGGIIKKVPTQPYLIGKQTGVTPSGFNAYDIPTKRIKSHAHMDLPNFWFSENGEYIFTSDRDIYKTASSTGLTNTHNTVINAIGTINTGNQNFYSLQYIYHNNNYLWVLQNNAYSAEEKPTSLCQIEDNDYTLVKNYYYDNIYKPDVQTTPFQVSAFYVFANKEGTEIMVLCKGININNNSWLIQFIPVI